MDIQELMIGNNILNEKGETIEITPEILMDIHLGYIKAYPILLTEELLLSLMFEKEQDKECSNDVFYMFLKIGDNKYGGLFSKKRNSFHSFLFKEGIQVSFSKSSSETKESSYNLISPLKINHLHVLQNILKVIAKININL